MFSFDTSFSGEITIWETTWGIKNEQSDYDERAEWFVGNTEGNWFSLGEVWNIADDAYGAGFTVNTEDLFGDMQCKLRTFATLKRALSAALMSHKTSRILGTSSLQACLQNAPIVQCFLHHLDQHHKYCHNAHT